MSSPGRGPPAGEHPKLRELREAARVSPASLQGASLKTLLLTSEKLFDQGEAADGLRDLENAYIYYMRGSSIYVDHLCPLLGGPGGPPGRPAGEPGLARRLDKLQERAAAAVRRLEAISAKIGQRPYKGHVPAASEMALQPPARSTVIPPAKVVEYLRRQDVAFLFLDVRRVTEFVAGHVQWQRRRETVKDGFAGGVVHLDPHVLHENMKPHEIEAHLAADPARGAAAQLFSQRRSARLVIYYDADSRVVPRVGEAHPLRFLLQALWDNSLDPGNAGLPVMVEGGWAALRACLAQLPDGGRDFIEVGRGTGCHVTPAAGAFAPASPRPAVAPSQPLARTTSTEELEQRLAGLLRPSTSSAPAPEPAPTTSRRGTVEALRYKYEMLDGLGSSSGGGSLASSGSLSAAPPPPLTAAPPLTAPPPLPSAPPPLPLAPPPLPAAPPAPPRPAAPPAAAVPAALAWALPPSRAASLPAGPAPPPPAAAAPIRPAAALPPVPGKQLAPSGAAADTVPFVALFATGPGPLKGLKNLGNTCFMSCTLQCLYGLVPLARYFNSGEYRRHVNPRNPLGSRGAVVDAFASLLRSMWSSEEAHVVNPARFKDAVTVFAPQFRGKEQHDAQEFLSFLLDGLHEDLNSARSPDAPPLPAEPTPQDEAGPAPLLAQKTWARYVAQNQSIVVDMFQGQLENTLQCLVCGKESRSFNSFMYLSLPIPGRIDRSSASKRPAATLRSPNLDLYDCLDDFTTTEILDGANAWKCPHCRIERRAAKSLALGRLPRVLLVHLKRFSFDGPFRNKIDAFVDFPLRTLDLSDYVPASLKAPGERFVYMCIAIANHYGTLTGGHYTAFVLDTCRRQWNLFDDTRVIQVAHETDVKTQAAYILYYVRVV